MGQDPYPLLAAVKWQASNDIQLVRLWVLSWGCDSCLQFKNNTEGQLSVYVFDSSNGSVNKTGGDYLASACRFTINLTIERAADAPIKDSQFYYGSSWESLISYCQAEKCLAHSLWFGLILSRQESLMSLSSCNSDWQKAWRRVASSGKLDPCFWGNPQICHGWQ